MSRTGPTASAAYWVVVVAIRQHSPYGVEYGTRQNVAARWTINSGPYSTKAAADSAAARANGGSGSGDSGGGGGGQGGAGGGIQPGDLICWGPNEHMGIALDAQRMVSAEDPANGTAIADIAGFFSAAPVVLRLKAVAAMGTLKGNQAIGALQAGKYGWAPSQDPAQWAALVRLWDRESEWSVTATNPSSGAYGIPQALPASKMASIAANWRTSAVTQIRWGLKYIKKRYGSPAGAWAHEQQYGWY